MRSLTHVSHRRSRRQHGAVLIGVIMAVVVGAIMLAGMARYAVSHSSRAIADADYAAAMDLAEAGANFEFARISADIDDADQAPGVTYNFGRGTFTVYCAANMAGTNPWPPATGTPPNNLYVFSTGTVNGVSRTIRVSVRGVNMQGDYAVYGIRSVTLNGTVSILGDIGTNGTITDIGNCDISGSVYLNGAGTSYSGDSTRVVHNPDPLLWPTVDDIVNERFPDGGWTYLATHNDNALCAGPNFSNNRITGEVTLIGRPGGANYYVTDVDLGGNRQIRFQNSGGPINIFLGPSGAAGSFSMRGTTDGTTDTSVGGFQVNIFVGSRSGIDLELKGNASLRANVYSYNGTPGDYYGGVRYSGTPDVYGTVMGYDVALNGTPEVHYVIGAEQPEADGYYGFDDSWVEINPR